MIVFVSYSSLNRELAEGLALQLGELGHDVEFEVKIIGDPITWRQVLASIRACDLFVSVLTSASLASYTCEIEYQYAQALGKNILPVLMDEVTMMGTRLESVIDYRHATLESQANLARSIASLPPPRSSEVMFPSSANWIAPLAELRHRIETLNSDKTDQQSISLNVREFLERQETFAIAVSLLDLLMSHPQLHHDCRKEAEQIQTELYHRSVSNRAEQRKRIIAGAVTLSLLVAIIAFILSQLFFRYRAERITAIASTNTAQSKVSLTSSPVTNLTFATAAIMPSATLIMPSSTAMNLPATNTLVVPTETFTSMPPSATLMFTPPPVTLTSIPWAATSISTTVPPSSTPLLSFMATATPAFDLIGGLPKDIYLGIEVEDTALGVLVKNVGVTAKATGVKVGDYVLAVDLDVITTRQQFLEVMQTREQLSRVTLRVRRGGAIQILTFILGANDFEADTQS